MCEQAISAWRRVSRARRVGLPRVRRGARAIDLPRARFRRGAHV